MIHTKGQIDDDDQVTYGRLVQYNLKTDLEVAAIEGHFVHGLFEGKIK